MCGRWQRADLVYAVAHDNMHRVSVVGGARGGREQNLDAGILEFGLGDLREEDLVGLGREGGKTGEVTGHKRSVGGEAEIACAGCLTFGSRGKTGAPLASKKSEAQRMNGCFESVVRLETKRAPRGT